MAYDDFVDQAEEARQDDEGARYGDPRRCPHHPEVATSSPDGMFDGPCWKCEGAMDDDSDVAIPEVAPVAEVTEEVAYIADDIEF